MWMDSTIRKTLYLSGGMSDEVKLTRVHKAVHDQRFRKIHIVGYAFEEPEPPPPPSIVPFHDEEDHGDGNVVVVDDDDDDDDGNAGDGDDTLTLTGILADLLRFDGRRWKSIKLTGCKGRVDLAVQAIVRSTVSRLIIASTEIELEQQIRRNLLLVQQQEYQQQEGQERPTINSFRRMGHMFVALGQGLQVNESLSTLGFQNIALSKQNIQQLCQGFRGNKCLMELNFQKCRFHPDAVVALATGLSKISSPYSSRWDGINMQLNHLNFQHCRLTDDQIAEIVVSLSQHYPFLQELSLDGNQCGVAGMRAIAKLLESTTSNLLVLDLASQEQPQPLQPHQPGQQAREPHQHDINYPLMQNALPLKFDLTNEFCNALATNNRLTCLQLSDNPWSNQSITRLATVLETNRKLRVLHLAWCDLSSPLCMPALADALTHNVTLSKLILYETMITPSGIEAFSDRLPEMKGLKSLDIGGRQLFGREAGVRLLQALGEGGNVDIEEIILRRSLELDADMSMYVTFYTDLNRAGRRFLLRRNGKTHLAALWPLILQRAQHVELSITQTSLWEDHDGNGDSNGDLMSENGERDSVRSLYTDHEEMENSSEIQRRASAMYYLLRNGALLER